MDLLLRGFRFGAASRGRCRSCGVGHGRVGGQPRASPGQTKIIDVFADGSGQRIIARIHPARRARSMVHGSCQRSVTRCSVQLRTPRFLDLERSERSSDTEGAGEEEHEIGLGDGWFR